MVEIELELTYLAKEIPKDLNKFECKRIVDIYFPKSDLDRKIRLRQNGDKYEITKKYPLKGRDSSVQVEETINLTKEEFEEFLVIEGLRLEKRRYNYNCNGRIAEVDVFEGDLKGLVVVDFEFQTEDEMKKFQMPNFCLVEVTQEKFLSGGSLAGKKYEDIEKELNRFEYKKLKLD